MAGSTPCKGTPRAATRCAEDAFDEAPRQGDDVEINARAGGVESGGRPYLRSRGEALSAANLHEEVKKV